MRGRKWPTSVAVLALSLLAACAQLRSLSVGLPIPPRVDPPRLDVSETGRPYQIPAEFPWVSTKDETEVWPSIGFTERAWEAVKLHIEALTRAYCEGRATIEIANGKKEPERIPLCGGPHAPGGNP